MGEAAGEKTRGEIGSRKWNLKLFVNPHGMIAPAAQHENLSRLPLEWQTAADAQVNNLMRSKSNAWQHVLTALIAIRRESNCYMVPSTVTQRREREIKLKATKEEYLKNLRELAAKEEEVKRRQQREDEEFEDLARESADNCEEFSKIIETTETTNAWHLMNDEAEK